MTISDGNGARWVRAALQVNPYEYKGASSPQRTFDDEESYNSAILDKCEAERIELIAITDHWAINSALGLVGAASERGITALPGFEANTSEGIHLLVIFERDTPFEQISAAIGQCGRDISPGCASGTTGDSFADIVDNMTARGALVIPAHVNTSPRGMLTVFSGQPLAALIRHDHIHALAVSPAYGDAPDQASVLAGRAPFDRDHPLGMIYGDDISHPDRLGDEGGSCWFKMSTLGLAGLRLAVRTPETRIRCSDPASRQRVHLGRISWTGGYLDGQTVRFAEDLTALIGGRGTGKSTVIESLRYVLDLEPIGPTATQDHGTFVDQVLELGTIVELTVDAVSPVVERYKIRRTVPDPPVVVGADGLPTDLHPHDVVGTIEIFGQHELAEVAEQPANVAQLITRFTEAEQLGDIPELQLQLKANRAQLAKVEQEQADLDEELGELPRLQATVDQFASAEWSSRLAAQQRLAQDEAIVNEASQRVTEFGSALEDLLEQDPVAKLRSDFESLAESPERPLLEEAKKALDDLAQTLQTSMAAIEDARESAETLINGVAERLQASSRPRRAEHAEVVRQLKADGHDPDRLIATQQRVATLASKSSKVDVLQKRHASHLETRHRLLGELEFAETQSRRHLGDAVREANLATVGTVVAKPVALPDRDKLRKIVTSHVSGSRKALLDLVEQQDFSPRRFVVEARNENLKKAYRLTDAQIDAINRAGEDLLRKLEELVVERAVEVSLNVAGDGQPVLYKALDSLSKGQRATALLLLLLGVASGPLIIDQPEDDLDNRFIYSGIVRHLRALKGRRQIIVSTHNANVPVLGDAELIVTLEGNGLRGSVSTDLSGSLDEPRVMRAAEDILEGGHKAFATRRHLYGF